MNPFTDDLTVALSKMVDKRIEAALNRVADRERYETSPTPEDALVERVARALFEQIHNPESAFGRLTWAQAGVGSTKAHYRSMAETAIKAVREAEESPA